MSHNSLNHKSSIVELFMYNNAENDIRKHTYEKTIAYYAIEQHNFIVFMQIKQSFNIRAQRGVI